MKLKYNTLEEHSGSNKTEVIRKSVRRTMIKRNQRMVANISQVQPEFTNEGVVMSKLFYFLPDDKRIKAKKQEKITPERGLVYRKCSKSINDKPNMYRKQQCSIYIIFNF